MRAHMCVVCAHMFVCVQHSICTTQKLHCHYAIAPANLPPGNEAENECEEDDFRYFQIECPAFSGTVIVEQIDIVGHCAIYVSTTIVNPGPLDSANETHRDESIDVSRRRVIITISITRVRKIINTQNIIYKYTTVRHMFYK